DSWRGNRSGQTERKTNEYNIPTYMAFVDYEKAFDSIQHKAVFKALKQHGVEDNYINILKETYDGAKNLKNKTNSTGLLL
uniref:Reverse transcriptase domain-containing protein n=1 Tax=Amphiprion ocellaris TaxID=80972 RepID=A0A3Q1BYB5_AMPOC